MSGRGVRDPGELLLEGGEGRKDVGVEATKERVGRAERGPLSGWSPLPGAAAEASTDMCLQTPAC